MQCGVGDYLAESGFRFYEKLHEPIFLVNTHGKIIKINNPGRKLMAVAHLTMNSIESLMTSHFNGESVLQLKKKIVLSTRNQNIFLSIRKMSGYFLIEVRRGIKLPSTPRFKIPPTHRL
jgi:sensor histidine kinase regulating citrate/malate metabolism